MLWSVSSNLSCPSTELLKWNIVSIHVNIAIVLLWTLFCIIHLPYEALGKKNKAGHNIVVSQQKVDIDKVCILKIKRDKNHRIFFFFFLHYLVNIEVLSQKGALLFSRLSAVIDQDLSESCYSLLWLAKCEGLTPNCKVDVIFCQRPPSLLIHLHGLAVTP